MRFTVTMLLILALACLSPLFAHSKSRADEAREAWSHEAVQKAKDAGVVDPSEDRSTLDRPASRYDVALAMQRLLARANKLHGKRGDITGKDIENLQMLTTDLEYEIGHLDSNVDRLQRQLDQLRNDMRELREQTHRRRHRWDRPVPGSLQYRY